MSKKHHNSPPSGGDRVQVDFTERIYETVGKTAKAIQSNKVFWATFAGSFLVLVYTVITGFAWWQSRSQMHIDYRPWVRVEAAWPPQPPTTSEILGAGSVLLENVGKSPADHIHTGVVVEILLNGESPHLAWSEQEGPKGGHDWGAMFPSTPPKVMPVALLYADKERHVYPRPITQEEAENLKSGKAYIVVFGMTSYQDMFKVKHWTKFCHFHSYSQSDTQINVVPCANFNEVDANY